MGRPHAARMGGHSNRWAACLCLPERTAEAGHYRPAVEGGLDEDHPPPELHEAGLPTNRYGSGRTTHRATPVFVSGPRHCDGADFCYSLVVAIRRSSYDATRLAIPES